MRRKWKRVSPRGNMLVGGSKRMNRMRVLGIYTLLYSDRVIDQWENAANNNVNEEGIV